MDNDNNGSEDITFRFRFKTEIRLPGVFTGFVGNLANIPPITALDGDGSKGLSLRQTYSVTMVPEHGRQVDLTEDRKLFAVPANVGPRTMPTIMRCASRGFTTSATVFASSPALWLTLSLSIWEQLLTLSASAKRPEEY